MGIGCQLSFGGARAREAWKTADGVATLDSLAIGRSPLAINIDCWRLKAATKKDLVNVYGAVATAGKSADLYLTAPLACRTESHTWSLRYPIKFLVPSQLYQSVLAETDHHNELLADRLLNQQLFHHCLSLDHIRPFPTLASFIRLSSRTGKEFAEKSPKMDGGGDPERQQALEQYKNKLLESREWEAKLKELRMDIKGLQKDFETTEDNIKALQSVGQIIGEVLKQLDEERCTHVPEGVLSALAPY